MRKILVIILAIVIIITSIFLAKYIEYAKNKNNVENINKEYLAYENKNIQINTIVSLMNKAIEQNKKNKVVQNDDKVFVENDNNSIKIYIETRPNSKSDMVKISMEELILNDKIGVEKVEYAFSDLIFEITDVKYHEKNGQIKEITFTSKE